MDYSLVVIMLGLIAYGVFEYRHRERKLRRMLRDIARGEIPGLSPERPAIWKLVTVGFVGALLLAAVLYFGRAVLWAPALALPMGMLGLFFAMILGFLILIFVRDVRAFRMSRTK